MPAPTHLRVEHLDHALGTTERRPRLSWRLPLGSASQIAYQVEVDGVAGQRVYADESVLVPWPNAPLGVRQRVAWRVKVWTDVGESDWSAPMAIEAGLLGPVDWMARWIEPEEAERPDAG